jgi:PAS domain S-box-containing protein
LDAAELAVSELVTNAALHAETPVELRVAVAPDLVRVEVRDFSATVPRQRHYGAQATTGRGLALVAAIADSYGVTPLPDGKIVWFTLLHREPVEPSLEDLVAAWDEELWDVADADAAVPGPAEGGLQTVHLQGVPPTLWLAARQHHDALLRELFLYLARHDDVLVDLARVAVARQTFSNAVFEAIEAADRTGPARSVLPQGHPSPLPPAPTAFDMELRVGPEAGLAAAALQDALDAAERLAHRGRLLAFPGQPELVAVRDWVCEQVQSQLKGVEPRPWVGSADRAFEIAGADREGDDRDRRDGFGQALDHVLDSERGLVAADEGNRIVAVSAALAAALGWQVGDLLGRRIVALIPPALREAHVAGFSRHLTTGEAHVLGVQLTLPVLHRDGREISCRFMIEKLPAPAGRSLYLAHIDAVEAETDVAGGGPGSQGSDRRS